MMQPQKAKPPIAIVPVRAGSKGLAGKNIRPIAGVPLYRHAVDQGLRTVGNVILSTDIAQITQASLPTGCALSVRPARLAADETPMASVIKHLIEVHQLQDQTLILLQATSPLRTDDDVCNALKLYQGGQYEMVFSVVKQSQSVLKYGTLEQNDFTPIQRAEYCFMNRQSLPSVYGPNGAVYVFDAQTFLENDGFPCGAIGVIKMREEHSVDVDCAQDLARVEQLWSEVHS